MMVPFCLGVELFDLARGEKEQQVAAGPSSDLRHSKSDTQRMHAGIQ